MSRPATRKQLLESIEHLQKMLTNSESATRGRVEALKRDLIDAAARIEVYEFLARLQHGAKDGSSSSARTLTNDLKPQGLDASIYGTSPAYDVYRGPR